MADNCFYIQNQVAIGGKKRIDLSIDTPPDLAIEIDITSRTQFNNYEALGVPDLWKYNGRKLQINVVQEGKYVESKVSYNFPNLSIVGIIHQYVEQSKTLGRNATMRAFRNWVKEQIP